MGAHGVEEALAVDVGEVDEDALCVQALDELEAEVAQARAAAERGERRAGRADLRRREVHERHAHDEALGHEVEGVGPVVEGVAPLDAEEGGVLTLPARLVVLARRAHDGDVVGHTVEDGAQAGEVVDERVGARALADGGVGGDHPDRPAHLRLA